MSAQPPVDPALTFFYLLDGLVDAHTENAMSGAFFILVINLFVAGLLAAAFMTIAVYDARRVSARWMAASYLLGMAYFAVEFSIPAFSNAIPVVVFAFAVLLAAMLAFNVAVARRYDVAPPWRSMVAFLIASTIVVSLVQDMPRQSLPRMMAYQLPYAMMTFMAIVLIGKSRVRRRFDRVLVALLWASAAQFAAKPFIAQALGGWGASPQAYSASNYAAVSQTLGTFFMLAIALLMLVMMARDVLADATLKSETDALSGLMNRRGFEYHAQGALRRAARPGIPTSLVIADIDHFKSINDGFGHAVGDRVIKAFADYLRQASGENPIAGRIGGEEFAILLPGTNVSSAKLFCEGARSAFATLPIEGLPAAHRCTASFGVAEFNTGEDFAELMGRADQALYAAKRDGRDRVRASVVQLTPATAGTQAAWRPTDRD